jgi:hypothetical protein
MTTTAGRVERISRSNSAREVVTVRNSAAAVARA